MTHFTVISPFILSLCSSKQASPKVMEFSHLGCLLLGSDMKTHAATNPSMRSPPAITKVRCMPGRNVCRLPTSVPRIATPMTPPTCLLTFSMDDGAIREEVLMDVMNHQQAEREAQRVQANGEELVERIARA